MPPKFSRVNGDDRSTARASERVSLLDDSDEEDGSSIFAAPDGFHHIKPQPTVKDGIAKVKSEIKGVMGIMQDNISKVLDRGSKLEDLQDKSAVDGAWGKWGPWSACSLTCGIGLRSRERKCDSPEPRNGGVPCNRAERMQQRFCRVARCGVTQGNDLGFSGSGYGWETSPDTLGSGEDKDGWTVYYGKKKQHQGFSDDEDLVVKSRPLG